MPSHNWTEWRPFPDPCKGDYLHAPFGPGVYVLRHRASGELILFGQSSNVAQRMISLLPQPLGRGHRSHETKREYVLAHIEHRTLACADTKEARKIEQNLKANGRYKFNT